PPMLAAVPSDERGRGSRAVAWTILGLILAGGLAALFFFMYKSIVGSPAQVTVPSVVGFNEQQAKSTLQNAGFKVSVTDHASQRVAKGFVISQDPSGRPQADRGSTV